MKEIISDIIAGTVMKEVTWCFSIASRADSASNFGIMTWHPPTISMARADDSPPTCPSGAVCKYTCYIKIKRLEIFKVKSKKLKEKKKMKTCIHHPQCNQ